MLSSLRWHLLSLMRLSASKICILKPRRAKEILAHPRHAWKGPIRKLCFFQHFRVSVRRVSVAVAWMKRDISSFCNIAILFSSSTVLDRGIGSSSWFTVLTVPAFTEIYLRIVSKSSSRSFEKWVSYALHNIASELHIRGLHLLNFCSIGSPMSTRQASTPSTASLHLPWRSLYGAMLNDKVTLLDADCCSIASAAVCRNLYMRSALRHSLSTTCRAFVFPTRLQTVVKTRRAWLVCFTISNIKDQRVSTSISGRQIDFVQSSTFTFSKMSLLFTLTRMSAKTHLMART